MPVIDPNKNPVGLDVRLRTETNPKYRHMLEEVRFHVAVEAALDIQPAVDRLAPNAEYIVYEHGKAPVYFRGKKAIKEQFYDGLWVVMNPILEWDICLCTVDGDVVITEGIQKNAVRGTTLIGAGISADPEGFYLQDARHLVIWPFDSEGRCIGETVYMGFSTSLDEVAKRPLKPSDFGKYTGSVIEPT